MCGGIGDQVCGGILIEGVRYVGVALKCEVHKHSSELVLLIPQSSHH